jgi:ketosteroid isomerase-like protein
MKDTMLHGSNAGTDNKAIAVHFLEAFWRGAPQDGLALCAPDAVWRFQKSLRQPRESSVAEAVEWLMTRLVAGFDPESGYSVEVHNAIAEGEEAAVEYTARGRTRAGEIYANDYLVRFTMRGARIVSIRPYFDTHYVHRVLAPLD